MRTKEFIGKRNESTGSKRQEATGEKQRPEEPFF